MKILGFEFGAKQRTLAASVNRGAVTLTNIRRTRFSLMSVEKIASVPAQEIAEMLSDADFPIEKAREVAASDHLELTKLGEVLSRMPDAWVKTGQIFPAVMPRDGSRRLFEGLTAEQRAGLINCTDASVDHLADYICHSPYGETRISSKAMASAFAFEGCSIFRISSLLACSKMSTWVSSDIFHENGMSEERIAQMFGCPELPAGTLADIIHCVKYTSKAYPEEVSRAFTSPAIPEEKITQIFNAENVWPISIANLIRPILADERIVRIVGKMEEARALKILSELGDDAAAEFLKKLGSKG